MKHASVFWVLPAIVFGLVSGTVSIAHAENACSVPYADAAATDMAQPDYPSGAKDLGLGNVRVLVQVTITPAGKLKTATIIKSSNNSEIDAEALRVAKESRYSPKVINCHPVEGSYVFVVDFNPN